MTRDGTAMMRRIALSALMTWSLLPGTAMAQPAPGGDVSSDDMRQIEASVAADRQRDSAEANDLEAPLPAPTPRILQSFNPDMSLIMDVALAGFGGASRDELLFGGHDPAQPGFNLQGIEMHLSAHVDPYFYFASAFVFGLEGVELEEAYATTLALPGNLQMRAGQFLTRFGRFNALHLHQWHFADQPLVIQKFMGGDGNRGLGVEASWLSFLPWYLEAVLSANTASGSATDASYYAGEDKHIDNLGQALWTGAIKQFFPLTDDLSLLWGVSAQTAPNLRDGRTALYGTDIYLRFRPLGGTQRQSVSLQLEAILRDRSIPGSPRLQDAGGYVELIWNFDPRWEVGARSEWMSRISDEFVGTDSPQPRSRYAAQVTYYPSHFSRLRLQTSVDRPQWLEEPIFATVLAFEIAIGAHGAHSY